MYNLLQKSDFELIENLKINHYSRDSSFDYCYNYFKGQKSNKDVEKSCLMLWSYLSSWGMLRNSFLLKKSPKYLELVIEYINNSPLTHWDIDVNNYDDDTIYVLKNIYKDIESKLQFEERKPTITLVTKIMLGVFGNAPAFDTNFRTAFNKFFPKSRTQSFYNFEESLRCIKVFYENNKIYIDNYSDKTKTLDFESGKKTLINYPKAKIIDTYGFLIGEKILGKKIS